MTLPSLHRLRVFVAIVDAGSVSSGARHLGIGQSTASTHLRQLEVEVGTSLIDRTRGHFGPTEAGMILVGHARRLMNIADEAVDDLARISLRPLTGSLAVGATTTTTEGCFLPIALQRFASQYPDVALNLQVDNSSTLLRRVRDGDVGVAVIATEIDDPALTTIALSPEDQTVIVSSEHPLAGSSVDPHLLRSSVVLLREEGSATRQYQESLLSQWRIPGAHTWTLTSTSAIVAATAAGLGISCLPVVVCRDALALGKIAEIHLEPAPPPRPVSLVRRSDHHLTRAEEHFVVLVQDALDSLTR